MKKPTLRITIAMPVEILPVLHEAISNVAQLILEQESVELRYASHYVVDSRESKPVPLSMISTEIKRYLDEIAGLRPSALFLYNSLKSSRKINPRFSVDVGISSYVATLNNPPAFRISSSKNCKDVDQSLNFLQSLCQLLGARQGFYEMPEELIYLFHRNFLKCVPITDDMPVDLIKDAMNWAGKFRQKQSKIYRGGNLDSELWWINYWNQEQIEVINRREVVLSAPWARKKELEDGSIIVALTEEVPDLNNPDHLERLIEILQVLLSK